MTMRDSTRGALHLSCISSALLDGRGPSRCACVKKMTGILAASPSHDNSYLVPDKLKTGPRAGRARSGKLSWRFLVCSCGFAVCYADNCAVKGFIPGPNDTTGLPSGQNHYMNHQRQGESYLTHKTAKPQVPSPASGTDRRMEGAFASHCALSMNGGLQLPPDQSAVSIHCSSFANITWGQVWKYFMSNSIIIITWLREIFYNIFKVKYFYSIEVYD